LRINGALLVIKLLVVVRVHLQVVERKLLLDTFLECLSLFKGERVSLGNDGDDIDNIRELLQDDNVDGLERMAGGLDEKQAAVDAGILDVALSLGGELLPQVCRVLVFDVLDDSIPAAVVVDQVAIPRSIDDVEPQSHTVLFDDVRNSLDLCCGPDWLIGQHAALRVDQVRSKDGVDQC
jgi:hypothetical protein